MMRQTDDYDSMMMLLECAINKYFPLCKNRICGYYSSESQVFSRRGDEASNDLKAVELKYNELKVSLHLCDGSIIVSLPLVFRLELCDSLIIQFV